jgi:hypothetical protein
MLAAAASFATSAQATVNLLTNGSFESGPFVGNSDDTMVLLPESTTMTGWVVTGSDTPNAAQARQRQCKLDNNR